MFKVIWDKEYNGVYLTMFSAGEALAVSPRPVFWEELDLLGLNNMGWIYPHCSEPLLWACDRRYFYCGELVMEVKGGNIFDAPTVVLQEGCESLVLKPVDMDRLRQRNEDSMFIIEHEAMDFINQTYRRYKNISEVSEKNPDIDFQRLASNLEKKTKEEHVVVKEDCDSFDVMPLSKAEEQGKSPILNNRIEMFIASFSGGKDSQVVLDLISRVIPSKDFLVIYSDTGYELPSSLNLYQEIENYYKERYPELRFYTAKNHQPVLYYWDKMDSPSRIHRWCCAVMKTAPLYRLLKELNGTGKQPYVMAFEGVRAEESERRASYSRIGKAVKHTNVLNVRPIFEWNQSEIWLYLFIHGLPINEAYRKGLSRVGCVVCPLSSEIGDCMDNRIFPDTAKPFIDKLRDNTIRAGIRNVEDYIKQRKWKVRAGGNRFVSASKYIQVSTAPDFIAKLQNPQENILEWMKTLGSFQYTQEGNVINGELKYVKDIYPIKIVYTANEIEFEVKNISNDAIFISLLKRILNKTTHCVHCEVCEVECPHGALTVVPFVRINERKCVRCHRCLNFIDNGCEAANSIKQTVGNSIKTNKNMNQSLTTVNKYNTFGLRERWVEYYIEHYDSYFTENAHGLNTVKQLPIFKRWLSDSGILDIGTLSITEMGALMAKNYYAKKQTIWEIIWINLCNNSELCSWYIANLMVNNPYRRDEIDALFGDSFSQHTASVRENSLKAFQNTLKESPFGSTIPVGVITKEGSKVIITRRSHEQLSLVAAAYSLFRYAEKKERYSLSVSEFYDDQQTEGIYREFGISRDMFERLLLSIQEESNHVLRAELNMGLDNIILRDDLKTIDILNLML